MKIICKKCGVKKHSDDFSLDKAKKTGHFANCKSCQKLYYQKNKARILQYQKDHNGEYKAYKRIWLKKWRRTEEGKKRIAFLTATWRSKPENRKKYNEYQSDYYKTQRARKREEDRGKAA